MTDQLLLRANCRYMDTGAAPSVCKFILLSLLVTVLNLQGQAQVYQGDMFLSTQVEVNAFSYTEIAGSLVISGDSITDLSALSPLTRVAGNLEITFNPSLTSLAGLGHLATIGQTLSITSNDSLRTLAGFDDLTSIGGYLIISSNLSLASLSGLDNLTSVPGDLQIDFNPSLTSLTGLDNISSVGSTLFISSNASLVSLNGLDRLRSVGAYLYIISNDSLPSLSGLNHVTSVGSYLIISSNSSLSSLKGLDNVTTIAGDLQIDFNPLLTSLEGLNRLATVGLTLSISSNESLTSLSGLGRLTSVGADLYIIANNALTSLAGLNHISTIKGSFLVSSNSSLTSLKGLDNITTIVGDMQLDSNSLLNSLEGLNKLTHVGATLFIFSNESLASLAGLDHLDTVGAYLYITGNNSLTSLANLDQLASVGADLYVQYNPLLAACCILPAFTMKVKGVVSISDNAPGCNSLAEINTACNAPATLSISSVDGSGQQTTGNVVRPCLQLNNRGATAAAYKDITLRYWLTVEEFDSLNTTVNWAQLGTAYVHARYVPLALPRSGAYGYVEYTFSPEADSLAAMGSSGPILSQISKGDWSSFNQADDYSYADASEYTSNPHITAYYNGTLVWGTEPAAEDPLQSLTAYSATRDATTSGSRIGLALQVSNKGNTPVSYRDLTVRYWFTTEGTQPLLYQLDYARMGQLGITARFVKLPSVLPTADSYLELGFTAASDSLYPLSSTGELLQQLRKSDWSVLNQLNDYSFVNTGVLSENSKVGVYVRGLLAYGVEPAGAGVLGSGRSMAAAAAETGRAGLQVRVLSNPVQGASVELLISGAAGERVQVSVVDGSGRVVSERQAAGTAAAQRVSMPVGNTSGQLLYIRVSAGKEVQTVPVVKGN